MTSSTKFFVLIPLPLLALSLVAYLPAAAQFSQFRTNYTGAIVALNATPPVAPPAMPMVAVPPPTTLTVIQPIIPPAVAATPAPAHLPPPPPLSALNNPLGVVSDLNGKALGFTYNSALFWWLAYLKYEGAAASLQYNSNGTATEEYTYTAGTPTGTPTGIYVPLNPAILAAVNYLLEGNNFTMFRDFPNRQITLLVTGNLPLPVMQNPNALGYITYRPQTVSFLNQVPLNLQ